MAFVEVSVAAGIARVVLDRPPLNVIDLVTARELSAALEGVKRRVGVAVVVLEARGKAFSAGVDVRDHLPDRGAEMLREFHHACLLLLELEAPVVAAVRGAALGGGCELTLACDLVLAARGATFGMPEIKLGVFPPLAAVALPRMIPYHIASDMLLTGRVLAAEEALAIGLVNRVARDEDFGAALDALLAELQALSPASLRVAKQAMRLARRHPEPDEVVAAERLYVEKLLNAPDAIEGLKAFLEKRSPSWGRGKTVRGISAIHASPRSRSLTKDL